jgi:cell division transport system permease protein
MNIASLWFLIYEGFRNIRRNGLMSLAALGTITVALTMLGASVLSAYCIHQIAAGQPQRLNEVEVFLKVDRTREQAEDVEGRIRGLENVASVTLVTREEAWAEIQAGQPALKEAALDNPLPDAFRVVASDVRGMDTLTRSLRDPRWFPEINWVNASNTEVRSLLTLARVIRVLGGAFTIALFAATLLIIYNTVRLTVFARRREIRVMQLVGATAGFIRFPLLMEGLFYGIVGASLSCGLLWLAAREISRFVRQVQSPLMADVSLRFSPIEFASGLIAFGVLLGLIGSSLAMRRFLRQK